MAKQTQRTWIWVAAGFLFAVLAVGSVQADDTSMSTDEASDVNARFTAAMAAAEEAAYKGDRDVTVEHLRKAQSLRPAHPENLAIDFNLGIELSQRNTPRPAEALIVFERILATYNHMDYYSTRPVDSSSSMQFMVPKAGVLAANLMLGLKKDPQKAQVYLLRAMEQMNETYQKRIEDWSNMWPDKKSPSPMDGVLEEIKRKGLELDYEQRRADAADGNVFSSLEMLTVQAAVRQYGYSHGRHRPEVAIVVMREIIDRFPNTPMAKVAQGHIDKAMAMLNQELLDDLADKITYLPPPEPNAATQPATPSPPPSPGRDRDPQPKVQNSGLAATMAESFRTHRYIWLAGLAGVIVVVGVVLYARKRRT